MSVGQWCEMRRAWIRWEVRDIGHELVIVETDQEIAARGDPLPIAVGRWIVEAVRALRG